MIDRECSAITRARTQCTRRATPGHRFCPIHQKATEFVQRRFRCRKHPEQINPRCLTCHIVAKENDRLAKERAA